MRKAITIGMFDGVHLGHQALVQQLCALSHERHLQPGVFTFADHPMAFIAPAKAPKMLSTTAQRTRWLVEAGIKDIEITAFTPTLRNRSAEEFMRYLHQRREVDLLVIGFNHHFGKDRVGSLDDYRQIGDKIGMEVVGGKALIIDGITVSSSEIRRLISEGDLPTANKLLGRLYEISGIVGHGKNIGHTIGYPTANLIPFSTRQLLPQPGVYAGYATTLDGEFPAMVNIGKNPTVATDSTIKIEAHLVGYTGNLYGRPMRLSLAQRLRSEMKFSSLASLKEQLTADLEDTLAITASADIKTPIK